MARCNECKQLSSKRGMTRNDMADANAKLARFGDRPEAERYRANAVEMKRRADAAQLELEAHQAECKHAIASARKGPLADMTWDSVEAPLPPAVELAVMVAVGMTHAQIGEEYGVSTSTVSQRLRDSGVLDKQPEPLDLSFSGLPDCDWMDSGLCAQTDPESFFPEKGGSTREAKSVCKACPVQADCLDWAIATQQRFGIWGGKSERERRKLAAVMAGEAPKTEARTCALSECAVEIDVDERINKKFCTPEHAHRAAYLARTAS